MARPCPGARRFAGLRAEARDPTAILPSPLDQWIKWPTPVIPDSGQIDVSLVDGAFWGFYQTDPGTGASDIAWRVSLDGINWGPEKIVLPLGEPGCRCR